MTEHFGLSIRQACRALHLSRTAYAYKPDTTRDEPVISALQQAAERYPRYGFRKLFFILRRQGHKWNHKRIHRIYCLLKLNFRRKGKQRLPTRHPMHTIGSIAIGNSAKRVFSAGERPAGRCHGIGYSSVAPWLLITPAYQWKLFLRRRSSVPLP